MRNEHFVQRQEYMERIESALWGRENFCIITLVGMAGIGKTQLAKEYAHLSYDRYKIIWWFDAAKNLESPMIEFAHEWNQKMPIKDQIPFTHLSNRSLVNYIKEKLRTFDGNWLLIFDDAKIEANLKEYFPEKHGKTSGHIIITSKDNWLPGQKIQINNFQRHESISLLQKFLHHVDNESAMSLASLLEDYPLAIVQSAAYLKTHSFVTIQEYVDMFRKMRGKLMKRENKFMEAEAKNWMDYEKPVSATLQMSLTEISKDSQEASQLLTFIAFLASHNIPHILIAKWVETQAHNHGLDPILDPLIRHSLLNITHKNEDGHKETGIYYSIHEIVQRFIRDGLSLAEKKVIIERAAETLLNYLKQEIDEHVGRSLTPTILPHVIKLLEIAEEEKCHAPELLKLRILYLDYLLNGNRKIPEAKKQVHLIGDALKNTNISNVFYDALYHINKGSFHAWGNVDYPAAISSFKKALALLDEMVCDQRLRALTQIAQIHLLQGEMEEAKIYLDQASKIEKDIKYIPWRVVYYLANSTYLSFISSHKEAFDGINIALDLLQKGESHPTIIFGLELFKAEVLIKLGKYAEAHALSQKTLKNVQQYFQNDKTLFSPKAMMLIAHSMDQTTQENRTEALNLLKSAIQMFTDVFQGAKKHRLQAYAHLFLGDVYQTAQELEKAYASYKTAEEILHEVYTKRQGDDFSELYFRLALLGAQLRNDDLMHQYLSLHIDTFGLDHPRTREIFRYLDEHHLPIP